MEAFIFPGQGAQFSGMGKELYENYSTARDLFHKATNILGFNIGEIMFEGSEEDLRQTKVTQPAIFLHSVILSIVKKSEFTPSIVAGHSLGEFSALAAIGALSFENGLKLVAQRAFLMQQACEAQPSTMAAVVRIDINKVEQLLKTIKNDIVVPANYNSPDQLVISGTVSGIEAASKLISENGGRTIPLKVGGAFHSPLMEPAKKELAIAINNTPIKEPVCPIYQNVTALPVINADIIKSNLINQLTSPVRWTQTMQNMLANGVTKFYEVGPGTVLQNLVKKVNDKIETYSL